MAVLSRGRVRLVDQDCTRTPLRPQEEIGTPFRLSAAAVATGERRALRPGIPKAARSKVTHQILRSAGSEMAYALAVRTLNRTAGRFAREATRR